MDVEFIRDYCLKLKGVEESFPFDENTLVFKVGGKMFLLLALDSNPISINVKCEPNYAVELREKYHFVEPGYHMNKKHWNTIVVDGSIKDAQLREWIDHSYDLVVQALPRKLREQLS